MISTYDVFNHYDYFRSQNEVKRVPLEDVNQYVKAHLLTPKEYYFYFPIYNLADYPDKYRIGYCHVKQFKLLPSHIQEAFESTWIQDYQTNPGHFPELDQFLNHRRRTLIIQTPMIQANTSLKAAEKAKELVENSLDLLRVLNHLDSPVREYYFSLKGSSKTRIVGYMSTVLLEQATMSYDQGNDTWMTKFNSVLTEPRNQIAKKIANAIRIFGTAGTIRQLDVKFTLLVFALEALLLTGSDRDYLGWKLAERVAFLISEPESRKETYRKIAKLYSKRSGFVHQDEKGASISEGDYHKVEGILIKSIMRLLELKDGGFAYFTETVDKPSIIQYIDNLKFSKEL